VSLCPFPDSKRNPFISHFVSPEVCVSIPEENAKQTCLFRQSLLPRANPLRKTKANLELKMITSLFPSNKKAQPGRCALQSLYRFAIIAQEICLPIGNIETRLFIRSGAPDSRYAVGMIHVSENTF